MKNASKEVTLFGDIISPFEHISDTEIRFEFSDGSTIVAKENLVYFFKEYQTSGHSFAILGEQLGRGLVLAKHAIGL